MIQKTTPEIGIEPTDKLELKVKLSGEMDEAGNMFRVQEVTVEGIVVVPLLSEKKALPLFVGTTVTGLAIKNAFKLHFKSRVLKILDEKSQQILIAIPAEDEMARINLRNDYRVPTLVPIDVYLTQGQCNQQHKGMVIDLSLGGCALILSSSVPVGTPLWLKMKLPCHAGESENKSAQTGNEIRINGHVKRVDRSGTRSKKTPVLGIKFDQVSQQKKNELHKYIVFRQRELIREKEDMWGAGMVSRNQKLRDQKRLEQTENQKTERLDFTTEKLPELQEQKLVQNLNLVKPNPEISAPRILEEENKTLASKGIKISSPPETGFTGKTILVVDDDPGVRMVITETLFLKKYRVIEAANGQEALDIVSNFKVDLVLTDLMMPGMNGWQLLKKIRENHTKLPVVILTGYMTKEGKKVLNNKEIAGFLVKPIELETLLAMVHRILFLDSENRKYRILLVEDMKDVRMLIGAALKKEGFLVTEAADGMEALNQVDICKPDLVLMDIAMPNMDGFEVCKYLRARSLTAKIPIFLITAKTTNEYVQKAIILNIDGYIAKPFNIRVLLERIAKKLRIHEDDAKNTAVA